MKTGAVLTEYKKMPDEELLRRYKHRHEHLALTPLFERYGHLVFGICLSCMKRPAMAANATHAIFISLVDDLKKYEAHFFKPWLYSYTLQYCKTNGYSDPAEDNDNITAQFSQKFTIDTAAQAEELEKAINSLSAEQRKAIELFYLSTMNYKEIATAMAYSLEKVKKVLRSGKQSLKEQVQRVGA